jgi:hypothetical protein
VRCPVNQITLLEMTNVNSGYKRTWDGVENDAHKRPRSHGELPRDWRDVHLTSPARKAPPPPGRHSTDRRAEGRGESSRRWDDHKRGNDYGRDRGRRDDRDRGYRDERPRSHSKPHHISGSTHPMEDGEEKEEGE